MTLKRQKESCKPHWEYTGLAMRNLAQSVILGSLAAITYVRTTAAITPVPDANMTALLRCRDPELAMKAQPMFLIGQMLAQPPCIPTLATSSGKQAAPSKLCSWPKSGCDCRNPGLPVGNSLTSLPVYFSYKRCSETALRVAYNLFYTKDGFTPRGLFGHAFDWERVVVVWNKTGSEWTPSQLFLSQHKGYQRVDWSQIESTFQADDAKKPRGGCDGQKNLDHPKIWIDVFSQLTDNAYRSDDWWYFPKTEDYILADSSTEVGKLIASFDWGDADSTPPRVADGLCDA
ncbi:hypothetical protein E4U09_007629 [Claviceps aff. purpurea]|uniref:Necrosis inducing protein n=1 Tax=Claviceps aff. purpurea TaxID=1967640 RepID=A0A9P7QLW3_9HYPO|nr:hypothetical protein E4U09_007629 [Claviceps aff. purpurea]